MAELKKCPFCKSKNLYIIHDKISIKRKTFVECQDCKATAPIEAWNNRVTEAEIRNKAIEEFVAKAYLNLGAEDCDIYCKCTIDEIAEQLKGE